jgi:hypothetical protein
MVLCQLRQGPNLYYMIKACSYGRKINCSLYNPDRKYETEDVGAEGDSLEECKTLVDTFVNDRISALSSEYKATSGGKVMTKP